MFKFTTGSNASSAKTFSQIQIEEEKELQSVLKLEK